MDNFGNRGIRVSRMDLNPEDNSLFLNELELRKLNNTHVRDALILASKVANAPGVVAELCWSDDPDYPAGYVASKEMGYYRFTSLKPKGSQIGGRVFFIQPDTDLEDLRHFLETKPVLVNLSKEWTIG